MGNRSKRLAERPSYGMQRTDFAVGGIARTQPVASERSIPAEQRDSGKKLFHVMSLVFLILLPVWC